MRPKDPNRKASVKPRPVQTLCPLNSSSFTLGGDFVLAAGVLKPLGVSDSLVRDLERPVSRPKTDDPLGHPESLSTTVQY